MAKPYRSWTRIAAACATVSASGLAGAVAAYERAYRGVPVWVGGCLLAGVILGGFKSQRLRGMARRAILCAAFLPPAALGFHWIRWIALSSIDLTKDAPGIASTASTDDESSIELLTLLPLTVVAYLAAVLIIVVATIWTTAAAQKKRTALNIASSGGDYTYRLILGAATGLELWVALDAFIGL